SARERVFRFAAPHPGAGDDAPLVRSLRASPLGRAQRAQGGIPPPPTGRRVGDGSFLEPREPQPIEGNPTNGADCPALEGRAANSPRFRPVQRPRAIVMIFP